MFRKIWQLIAIALLIAGPALANTTTTNYGFNKPAVNDPVDEDIWGDLLNENFDLLDTTLDDLETEIDGIAPVPIGAVSFYAGSAAPSGWALSYGQAISRVTYSGLFSAIGTTYGSGDGTTTFNTPDCRGRVLAGQDDMGGSSANRLTDQSGGVDGDTLGDTGGEETHTLTTDEMPAHTHGQSRYTTGGSFGPDGVAAGGSPAVSGLTTASTGGGSAHNNIQPTLILNCIIYTGI